MTPAQIKAMKRRAENAEREAAALRSRLNGVEAERNQLASAMLSEGQTELAALRERLSAEDKALRDPGVDPELRGLLLAVSRASNGIHGHRIWEDVEAQIKAVESYVEGTGTRLRQIELALADLAKEWETEADRRDRDAEIHFKRHATFPARLLRQGAEFERNHAKRLRVLRGSREPRPGTGEHGIKCTTCGITFDARDLTQVMFHQTHRPTPVLDVAPGVRIKEEP